MIITVPIIGGKGYNGHCHKNKLKMRRDDRLKLNF
jgi:hypothetical protein